MSIENFSIKDFDEFVDKKERENIDRAHRVWDIQIGKAQPQTEAVETEGRVAPENKLVSPAPSPAKGDSGDSNVSESKSTAELGIGILHSVFSTLGSLSKESLGRWYILLCIISLLILDAVNSLVTKVLVYTGVPMYAGVSSLLLHFILRLIAAGIFDLSVWYVLKAVLKDKDKPVELKDNQGHVITKEHIILALLLLINLLYIIFNVICVVLSGKYEELNLGIIFAAFILIMTQN